MPDASSNLPLKTLIIVPAFNESASIAKLLHRLHRCLPQMDILVIDDGSTDHTSRMVPEYVTLVTLPFNLGIGGAMQTGYRYAALHGYDVAVQVDGDGQHRPSEVQNLIEKLQTEQADLVVGSRFIADKKHYRQTLSRRAGNWIISTLIRLLTGLRITDSTSGFRAANRRVIRAFAHWYPEDYPEPEVVLLLHRDGFKICETPVRMRQRRAGVSSISMLKGVFYVIKVVTCLLLDMARAPWPSGKVEEHEQPHPQPDPDRVRWQSAPAGGSKTPSIQA